MISRRELLTPMELELDRLRRGRRRWRWASLALLLLLVGTILVSHWRGPEVVVGSDWDEFDKKPFPVDRVVDGDTVRIDVGGGRSESVRLVGIDAPEVHGGPGGGPAHYGAEARDYLKKRLDGQSVVVRLQETVSRDKYGRLLAYLYLGDREDVNLTLVRTGHAYADRRFRHALESQFTQAEAEARKKKAGLWADVKDSDEPEWRQKWLADRASKAD